MQFTGQELTLKRNFYTQTGNYGFVANVTVDNTTGTYHFGLSGAQGVLDFTLQSGRMYYGGQFVQSYRSYEEFLVEGQFSSGAANMTKNDSALMYGAAKPTGNFDYFYFTRGSTNMGATFGLEVSGNNSAVYSISQQGYLFASGQNAVTGWFANQGAFPIRVFDSTIQASANYSFGKLAGNIASGASGAFAYTGDYSTLNFNQPILNTFATNFGDVSVLFSILDARSFSSFVQLTAPTDFSFNGSNVMNRDVSYLNFSGGFVTDGFNTNLTFVLGYVSGSGGFTNLANYSITGYGTFRESGAVTGLLSTITGSSRVTGFAWATGAATGFFSGMGTGMASGLGYTGLATGYMTGLATGFVFGGSGKITLTYPLVGTGLTASAIGLTGTAFATGAINISSLVNGDQFKIILPNGTDYTVSPLALFTANYLPVGPFDCTPGIAGQISTHFQDGSSLINCLSGFAALGLNGIYDGFNTVSFTATTVGSSSNGIAITGITSSIILPGTGYITGGRDGATYVGNVVVLGQPFTGAFPVVATGTGSYIVPITGQFYSPYFKTFTGSWQLATGGSPTSLVQFVPISPTLYSGNGTFPPNSFLNMQVTYNPSGITPDGAYLIVTGANVINGINQQLSLP